MIDGRVLAAEVYQWYAGVMRACPDGPEGRLLLVEAEARGGAEALVRGANIAGAATLLLIADAEQAQQRVRAGVCDFMVNGLDEAVRILKNQVRLRQAVSVCLLSRPAEVLEECVARGLQPDLLGSEHAVFAERGARVVESGSIPQNERLACWGVPAGLSTVLDDLALGALSLDGRLEERRRWLGRAPMYLGRELNQALGRGSANVRTMPMDDLEARKFAVALRQGIDDARLPQDLRAWYGEEALVG